MLAFIVFTSILILIVMLFSLIMGENMERSLRLRRRWAQLMLPVLGVRLQVYGAPPTEAALLVGNHRSYFDPIPLLCDVFAMPVGKSEIASWPFIGFGARVTGIIFVERNNKDQRKITLQRIAQTIQNGFFVLNYPEGTTHDQPATIEFKRGTFAMAARQGFAIIPIAMDYKNRKDAWIGDDTFVRHFFECFGKARTEIKLSYGQRLQSDDQQALLTECKNWIDGQLLAFRKDW